MDIKILHSHLTEYLETNATAKEIGKCMALCGPSCERVYRHGKNDWLYEIEITTNRVDTMSVMGIAREAAAILPRFGYKAKFLSPLCSRENAKRSMARGLEGQDKTQPKLTIKTDPNLTNRVMGVIMEVEMGESPQYIKDRIEATDIRSLNNLVDVTNYVMTEIGHPTHVFDYDRLCANTEAKGATLIIRASKKGEKITTLDNKTYKLPGGDIVIENGNGKIIDLPGIMGTANSVVSQNTKRILFFIDNNDPVKMRKTSMTLGIRTVAVTLNEKKVDPELGEIALNRGIELYKKIAKGKVISRIHDHYDNKPKPRSITVSHKFIQDRIGVPIKPKFIQESLSTLGFTTKIEKNPLYKRGQANGQGIQKDINKTDNSTVSYKLDIPSWRLKDIQIKEDILEEISRIYGYHNLPSIVPQQQPPVLSPQKDQFYWEKVAKHALKNWGWIETYSYSLVSKELNESVKALSRQQESLSLKNPLSTEWLYLRQSIVPSLLQSLKNNQEKQENLKLFELANIYTPQKNDLPTETLMLTLVQNTGDFYNLKGIIEATCTELGIKIKTLPFTQREKSSDILAEGFAHPEIAAKILIESETSKSHQPLGTIAQLHPEIQAKFELEKPVFYCELNFIELAKHATKNKIYTPIPKYPAIIEHLSFIYSHTQGDTQPTADEILHTAQKISKLVHQAKVIDSYENKITIELEYLDIKKNLTAEEITPIRQKIVHRIEELGIKLQGSV